MERCGGEDVLVRGGIREVSEGRRRWEENRALLRGSTLRLNFPVVFPSASRTDSLLTSWGVGPLGLDVKVAMTH